MITKDVVAFATSIESVIPVFRVKVVEIRNPNITQKLPY
jgi:hypothetical protein